MENKRELKPFFSRLLSSSEYEYNIKEVNEVSYNADSMNSINDEVDEMVSKLEDNIRLSGHFIAAVQQNNEDNINQIQIECQGKIQFNYLKLSEFILIIML